ncbi:hypothetical protein ACHAWF_010043 [Thalassiosira exigua]
MDSTEVALGEFVSKQKSLLELELQAEEDADGEGKDNAGGFCLSNVDVLDTSVGLYGRTVVSFANYHDSSSNNSNSSRRGSTLLPAHRLTVGDEVQIVPNNGKNLQSTKRSKYSGGVISALDDVSISVALFGGDDGSKRQRSSSGKNSTKKQGKRTGEEEHDNDGGEILAGTSPYALIPKSNVEVHRKMVMALDELGRQGVRHPVAGNIVMAAFEPSKSKHEDAMGQSRIEALESELNLASTNLDYSQKVAVVMALHSNSPISLIHGPPGTGKTTTVAELIRCAVHKKGWKVLVTAPSNVAVDNVLDRIMAIENQASATDMGKRKVNKKSSKQRRIKVVRLGHPARIQRGIQKYSLESLVQSSEGTEVVRDCRSELNEYLKTLSNAKSRPSEKRVAYREMKTLRKEIRSREEQVVGKILRDSNVVLATNVGAASSVLNRLVDAKGEKILFDLVVIDEAAQALEASCWISLLKGKRAVLAGDHKQLPPTIKCSKVQRELGTTLFERLMFAFDKSKDTSCTSSKMLEVQYRMHQSISDWASNAMYGGKLISHESVKGRKLSDLPLVAEKAQTQGEIMECDGLKDTTLLLVDTTGCDMHETANEAGSRYNEGEANIVVSHVQSLIKLGLQSEQIAVITPYNGQVCFVIVELLRRLLLPEIPKLEIRSVDGFQGGEREAVVLSLVRSSERGGKDGIGFLRDDRRLNVAVTRAKRHCAVICDSETISQNKFLKGLVDYFEKNGDNRSGAEYDAVVQHVSESKGNHDFQAKISASSGKEQRLTAENQPKQRKAKQLNEAKAINTRESAPNAKTEEPIESNRVAMMERIKSFSDTGMKGDEVGLSPSTDYDCVVACELANQLGLGCCEVKGGDRKVVLSILKDTMPVLSAPAISTTEKIDIARTPKFAQLNIGDDSDSSDNEEGKRDAPNNLLKELALERETRKNEQSKLQASKPSASSKKKKKGKGKAKKLGGQKQTKSEQNDDSNDLDDLAFLDAQIEKVQTSHGRKVEAKGKGYRSVVNGILLSKPSLKEEPKQNNVASSTLQAKLKSKAQDRKVKKKSK